MTGEDSTCAEGSKKRWRRGTRERRGEEEASLSMASKLRHMGSKSLEGKVVMVTGASSGIGRELCLDLSKAGCRVVAAARRVDRLTSLCAEINSHSTSPSSSSSSKGSGDVRAVAVELDIGANGAAVEKAVRMAWAAFGRIDALVNNAGVRGTVASPLDLPEEEWNTVMATNLTGTWLVTKFVCGLMRDAHLRGSVINVSSIAGAGRGQLPGGLAYAISKGGVTTMTEVLAMELGQYNIRVNSIAPGLFKSEITEGLVQKKWLSNVHRKILPLKESGEADPALTSLVRYLIDESSAYVSGNTFIVDAGATLPGIPIFSSL